MRSLIISYDDESRHVGSGEAGSFVFNSGTKTLQGGEMELLSASSRKFQIVLFFIIDL